MYRKKDIVELMEGKSNPFMENYRFPVTKCYDHTKHITGPDGIKLPKPFFREHTQSATLFYDKDVKDRISKLSDRAQRLYLYILYHLDYNQDFIVIDQTKYMNANEIKSPTTFKLAKMELADQGFIYKATHLRTYWINPRRFFCGSRPSVFPNNMDVKYEMR